MGPCWAQKLDPSLLGWPDPVCGLVAARQIYRADSVDSVQESVLLSSLPALKPQNVVGDQQKLDTTVCLGSQANPD